MQIGCQRHSLIFFLLLVAITQWPFGSQSSLFLIIWPPIVFSSFPSKPNTIPLFSFLALFERFPFLAPTPSTPHSPVCPSRLYFTRSFWLIRSDVCMCFPWGITHSHLCSPSPFHLLPTSPSFSGLSPFSDSTSWLLFFCRSQIT